MHTLTRIITQKKPIWTLGSPRNLLMMGCAVYTNEEKARVFFIRKVMYDNGFTPVYSIPNIAEIENTYLSLEELYKAHPAMEDTNVLDYDNNLSLWHDQTTGPIIL